MIKVKNLKKSFGDHQVLKGIDLEINMGDVVAVLGPSGSGKTTLLRCLNFLETANEGELTFDDKTYSLNTINKNEIHSIRNKTAFVFQNFNLFENKTALENVTIGLTVARKINKNEADDIGIKMLEKVGLKDKINSYPDQLSGGQQQRVAIARALATNPEIIYFDEPTSALDPELIGEVLNVIKELANENMTMIVVTHEMNFAKNISNRVVFMEDGKIIENKESKEFFDNPTNERIENFIKNIVAKGE